MEDKSFTVQLPKDAKTGQFKRPISVQDSNRIVVKKSGMTEGELQTILQAQDYAEEIERAIEQVCEDISFYVLDGSPIPEELETLLEELMKMEERKYV